MCNWCDACSGKEWKMWFFGHRQMGVCLQSWLMVGLEIFLLSAFCHCL